MLDSPEALNKWKEFGEEMKWFEECPSSNPYYPWKHEGELWLSDFLYRWTHVSMEQSDELLQRFADGRITMLEGPIQFKNTCQMHEILDVAANANMVSTRLLRNTISFPGTEYTFPSS